MYFKNGHGSILLIGNMIIVKTENTRAIVKIKDMSIRKDYFMLHFNSQSSKKNAKSIVMR